MAAAEERSQLQRAARTTFGRLPLGAEPRRARRSGTLDIPGLCSLRELAGGSGKDTGNSGKDTGGSGKDAEEQREG